MSETLYRKVGRRYVPFQHSELYDHADRMTVGTWRMTYAYADGKRRYTYDVRPDTASFMAACELARVAMETAIMDKMTARPSDKVAFTKRQLSILERYRREMAEAGGNLPTWWQHSSLHEIIDAGINAVREWKE